MIEQIAERDAIVRDTCENCRFGLFHPRRVNPANGRPVLTAPLAYVECKRFPTNLAKSPNDWCGEHRKDEHD